MLVTGALVKNPMSVEDLNRAIYSKQEYYGGCYKLLNITGPIGCAGENAAGHVKHDIAGLACMFGSTRAMIMRREPSLFLPSAMQLQWGREWSQPP